ncbi:MAG: protein kinase family protein [Clostridia bacterium]
MLFLTSQKYAGKKYGEYTIVKSVGEGRYGMCFLAQAIDGQKVILKRFKPSIFRKNIDKNAFEAVMLSQIQHPAIPKFLGVINQKGFYGFVLEHKKGDTVKELLFKRQCKFSRVEFYQIGCQLISIVKYLHENGIVHRDIRTPNVLLNQDQVYLLDFGLARWADTEQNAFMLDFSYLGDFFLYLLYSSFETSETQQKLPWHQELSISQEQKLFLKRLLRLEPIYTSIHEVENDFIKAFGLEV